MRRWLKAECAAVNFDRIAIGGGGLTDQVPLARRRQANCLMISAHAAVVLNELQAGAFPERPPQLRVRSLRSGSGHCRTPRNRKPHSRLPARQRRDAPIPWLAPGESRYEAAGRTRFGGTMTQWCGIGERFP